MKWYCIFFLLEKNIESKNLSVLSDLCEGIDPAALQISTRRRRKEKQDSTF